MSCDCARKDEVINLIMRYGSIDGAMHKQWVLTQILKTLMTPDEYREWLVEYRGEWDEDYEEYEYGEWDEGIPP